MSAADQRRIVFVCQHGAFRSRMAAAFFNSAQLHGWYAASAGLTSQSEVSVRLAPLLAGTAAEAFADMSHPRLLDPEDAPWIIAIDVPLDSAEVWTTTAEGDAELRDEISRRVDELVEEIGGGRTL